jgi:hypothetical protein
MVGQTSLRESAMPKTIHYSDGSTVQNAVIVVWEDLHNERAGYFRAFWAATPESFLGSPVLGYCSPGGSYRTIRAVAAEVRQYYPGETVYRNGNPVQER